MSMKLAFTVIFALVICQVIKAFVHYHQYHKFNAWVFLEDGGLPSAYSTGLFSLFTGLFYEQGVTDLFVVAVLLSLVFLNDLMKVKRQPGIQSELMARFIDFREIIRRKLTEGTPHTPENVFVGAILGFVVASIVFAF